MATQGYMLQKFNEQGDYLYFIYRGVCKVIYPVESLPNIFTESAFYDKQAQKYFVLG